MAFLILNKLLHNLFDHSYILNEEIVYLLWGKEVQIFEKNIKSGVIIKHNHPSNSGNLSNENDFFNGLSFENTKSIINWTGYDEKTGKILF